MSWNGKERRKVNMGISDNDQITDFKVFMAETVIYRTEQSRRMDKFDKLLTDISQKLTSFPCEKHAGFFTSIGYQVKVLWCFVVAIILAVIQDWVKRS